MKKIILLLSILSFIGCTEPYALESKNYEEAIVIEALITNENKFQEIKISKTYALDSNNLQTISNATVKITDNLGNIYNFIENGGKYISTTQFKAEDLKEYKLHIQTANGDIYESETVKFNLSKSTFSDISYEIITKNGVSGVQFYANSRDLTNKSKFYRFDFSETYKIKAPRWVPLRAIPNYSLHTLDLFLWDYEAHECYNTYLNKNVLIQNTVQNNDDVVKFPIRFLPYNDPKIGSRYSIIAFQYVLSSNSYNFYDKLKSFSENGNLLSQAQPGLLTSNIKPINNTNKIIGIFDMCTVSNLRIFVNYSDLFASNFFNYPYFCDCTDKVKSPPLQYCFSSPFNCDGDNINSALENRISTFFSLEPEGYYFFPANCGDCTTLGTNIKPSFWID